MPSPEQFGRYLVLDDSLEGDELTRSALVRLGSSRTAVLIRLREEHLAHQEIRDALVSELRRAVGLRHRNMVPLLHAGVVGGVPFALEAQPRGVSLARILEKCRERGGLLPLQHGLFIGMEVCKVLSHAILGTDVFSVPLRIPHGRLSPHHVFVAPDGSVSVRGFGFGLAWARLRQAQPSLEPHWLGYQAPEVWEQYVPTPSADVFAAGALIYECLTAQWPPAQGDDGQPLPPSAVVSDLPQLMDQIILSALRERPENRFLHATYLARILGRLFHLRGHDVSCCRLSSFVGTLFPDQGFLPPEAGADEEICFGKQNPHRPGPLDMADLPLPEEKERGRIGFFLRFVLWALFLAALGWGTGWLIMETLSKKQPQVIAEVKTGPLAPFGTLSINSAPQAADVFLELGQAPLMSPVLMANDHQFLTIALSGHRERSLPLWELECLRNIQPTTCRGRVELVSKDRPQPSRHRAKEPAAPLSYARRLEVSTEPPSAQVRLWMGQTPLRDMVVNTTHRISLILKLPGHMEKRVELHPQNWPQNSHEMFFEVSLSAHTIRDASVPDDGSDAGEELKDGTDSAQPLDGPDDGASGPGDGPHEGLDGAPQPGDGPHKSPDVPSKPTDGPHLSPDVPSKRGDGPHLSPDVPSKRGDGPVRPDGPRPSEG